MYFNVNLRMHGWQICYTMVYCIFQKAVLLDPNNPDTSGKLGKLRGSITLHDKLAAYFGYDLLTKGWGCSDKSRPRFHGNAMETGPKTINMRMEP